jgi:hypothetical protein
MCRAGEMGARARGTCAGGQHSRLPRGALSAWHRVPRRRTHLCVCGTSRQGRAPVQSGHVVARQSVRVAMGGPVAPHAFFFFFFFFSFFFFWREESFTHPSKQNIYLWVVLSNPLTPRSRGIGVADLAERASAAVALSMIVMGRTADGLAELTKGENSGVA